MKQPRAVGPGLRGLFGFDWIRGILFSGQSAERYGMDFSFPLSGVEGGDAKASLTETTQRGSGKDTRRFGDLA